MRVNEIAQRLEEFIVDKKLESLEEIFSDNLRFHSPFLREPTESKEEAITMMKCAIAVFPEFRLYRISLGLNSIALYFETSLRGVRFYDLIFLDEMNRIHDYSQANF